MATYKEAYATKNVKYIKARKAKYYQENKESMAVYNTQYRIENVTKINTRKAQYRSDNRDRINARNTQYAMENRAKVYENNAKRRVAKLNQTPDLTLNERQEIVNLYELSKFAYEVSGVKHHVDHIIPIAKGGIHHPLNLQVITAKENLTKNNRIPDTISEELLQLHRDFYKDGTW